MDYTIEIYKVDKRRKEGKKLIECVEINAPDEATADVRGRELTMHDSKLTFEVHETYRMVRNIMSGRMVREHYKTPYSCSVASESYWCS